MTNNALVIVDLQKGFINELTKDLPSKIEKIQGNYDRVYSLQFINLNDSLFRTELGWTKFSVDSEDVDFAYKVKPNSIIFQKFSYGASPELIADLINKGITSIDLCGCDTAECITKIAMDLFDNNILPRVLSDCCGSSVSTEQHKRGLKTLRCVIGEQNVI